MLGDAYDASAGLAAGLPTDAGSGPFFAGITLAQLDTAIASGVDPAADAVCFVHADDYLVVPDDPGRLTSAGTGRYAGSDPDWRCDATERCDSCADDRYLSDGNFNMGIVDVVSNFNNAHGPFGLGQDGAAWYRFPAGKGLATANPGEYHCGTDGTGWLSGWPAEADPPVCVDSSGPDCNYDTPADGTLPPTVGSPPARGTICFQAGGNTGNKNCINSLPVRAVSCGAFSLWELLPAVNCYAAYCLAGAIAMPKRV
eukprot:SAG31_NODE_8547_length_1432_cov_1.116279_2_plen_256_part_00